MSGIRAISVTVAMTLIAGALAYGAWDQVRPAIALVVEGSVRQFLFDFRFALGVLGIFITLSLGEMLVSRVTRRFGDSD